MHIININKYVLHLNNNNSSFILKFSYLNDFILFNCSEGCQSFFIHNNIKMNNLLRIIITDLHIHNISGLLGFLSSLNLLGRFRDVHIYGPKGLEAYLDLGKKYSHTNFSYMIYLHILKTGLILHNSKYQIYTFIKNKKFDFIISTSEVLGTFIINEASNYYLYPGPLYSKLKNSIDFILPDGLILYSYKFKKSNIQGNKYFLQLNEYYNLQVV